MNSMTKYVTYSKGGRAKYHNSLTGAKFSNFFSKEKTIDKLEGKSLRQFR